MTNKVVKDWLTENDGESFCPVRVGFIIGFICYITFTLYALYTNADTNFMDTAKDWIGGLAEYLGFGGASVAAKSYTEK